MPEERLYTDEEVAAALRDAGSSASGTTRAEVLAAAEEAGLDADRVSAALDRRSLPVRPDRKGAVVTLDFPLSADRLPLVLTELPPNATLRAKHTGSHFTTSFEKGLTFVNVEVFSDAQTTTVRVARSLGPIYALMAAATVIAVLFCTIGFLDPFGSFGWPGLARVGMVWAAVQLVLVRCAFAIKPSSSAELAQKIASRLRQSAGPQSEGEKGP